MPEGCWGLRVSLMGGSLSRLAGRPEQPSTPRRGDRLLGEGLAAAAEKQQAGPHATRVRRHGPPRLAVERTASGSWTTHGTGRYPVAPTDRTARPWCHGSSRLDQDGADDRAWTH